MKRLLAARVDLMNALAVHPTLLEGVRRDNCLGHVMKWVVTRMGAGGYDVDFQAAHLAHRTTCWLNNVLSPYGFSLDPLVVDAFEYRWMINNGRVSPQSIMGSQLSEPGVATGSNDTLFPGWVIRLASVTVDPPTLFDADDVGTAGVIVAQPETGHGHAFGLIGEEKYIRILIPGTSEFPDTEKVIPRAMAGQWLKVFMDQQIRAYRLEPGGTLLFYPVSKNEGLGRRG